MHIQYRPSVLSGTWGSKQFIRMHNSRLLVLVNRIARNRRENIFSYHLYFSQCFAWYLKKSVYQGIYLFLNYLILDMYIKPSTFRFWCFIFDKMVGSTCFLWSSTFTWSNSVRLNIRWYDGWRDEMTMTYAYKLTSEEIHIYFDIDLSTGFMQFMDAPRGLHSSKRG